MRFHLDESADGRIAAGLRHRGIDVTTPVDVGLRGASDDEHLAYALANERVLVTHDADFLEFHFAGARRHRVLPSRVASDRSPRAAVVPGARLFDIGRDARPSGIPVTWLARNVRCDSQIPKKTAELPTSSDSPFVLPRLAPISRTKWRPLGCNRTTAPPLNLLDGGELAPSRPTIASSFIESIRKKQLMGKIWVHIEPVVTSEHAGTKAVLTDSLKEALSTLMVERITGALPADKFSTENKDKPIKVTDAYNALKVVATLNLKVETMGSKMSVTCDLKINIEAIRAPKTTAGNLLGSNSKTATAENRGSGEKDIIANAKDALDPIVARGVKQILDHPTFKSYGKNLGLPL